MGIDAECRGDQRARNVGDSFIRVPARPNGRVDVSVSAKQVVKPNMPVIVRNMGFREGQP